MATLTAKQTFRARRLASQAALVAYAHRPSVHYSQGAERWDGIAHGRHADRGEYPHYADCSSFTTWCLWNALRLAYNEPDVVNRLNWDYGNTGSQIQHGKLVYTDRSLRMGDLVFYAYHGWTPTHVAIVVGRRPAKTGKPYVVSHGSEAGPLFLPFDYRRIVQMRRYI
jgi:hypothetical protein